MRAFYRFRRTTTVVALFAFTTSQACYSYLPLASAPTTGERVRVVLTPEGTTELARYLGPNVIVAEGEIASTTGDGSLVLAVDFVQTSNGIRQPWTGEGVVSFPAQYSSQVQQRTLSRGRSIAGGIALGVAIVGAAIFAIRAAGAQGGGEQTPPPPP